MAMMSLSSVDELAELQKCLGTQQAVADVLGKTRPQVARWLTTEPEIQSRNRRLINDSWSVVRLIRSFGVCDPSALTHTLLGRRPEFGFRRPAEMIWEDETDSLIAALTRGVPELEEVSAVPMHTDSVAAEIEQLANERLEPFALEGFEPYDIEGAARAGLVGLITEEQPLPAAPATVRGLTVAEPLDW